MGVTILTENVRNSIMPGLVVLDFDDVSELLQTMAVWRPDVMSGAKKLFVDFLRNAHPTPPKRH
jgi:hypothetical protein